MEDDEDQGIQEHPEYIHTHTHIHTHTQQQQQQQQIKNMTHNQMACRVKLALAQGHMIHCLILYWNNFQYITQIYPALQCHSLELL